MRGHPVPGTTSSASRPPGPNNEEQNIMTPFRITVTALTLVVAVPLARPVDEPPKHEGRTLGGHTGTVRVLYAPDGRSRPSATTARSSSGTYRGGPPAASSVTRVW